MTCSGCQSKVQQLLGAIPDVSSVNVDLSKSEAAITMRRHINTPVLQKALEGSKFSLSEKVEEPVHHTPVFEEEKKSWFQTYKPVLLLFAFITGVSFLAQVNHASFSWMHWMNHFMAAFFLSFSFFKLLNLDGFADSYSTYDIIAKKWRAYGYIYAFIELGLGIAYLSNFYPLLTNSIAFVVMSISLVGVLQSVLNKRKIKCACLGDVFNLPMSTITIIEDALMIAMSLFMIIYINFQ